MKIELTIRFFGRLRKLTLANLMDSKRPDYGVHGIALIHVRCRRIKRLRSGVYQSH